MQKCYVKKQTEIDKGKTDEISKTCLREHHAHNTYYTQLAHA